MPKINVVNTFFFFFTIANFPIEHNKYVPIHIGGVGKSHKYIYILSVFYKDTSNDERPPFAKVSFDKIL